jgi:hypothetical protein
LPIIIPKTDIMRKVFLLATATLLFTGVGFAQDSGKKTKDCCKKEGKACCKKESKSCCKKDEAEKKN